jgi:hypothetical protein
MTKALLPVNKRSLALDRLSAFKDVLFGLTMPLFPRGHASWRAFRSDESVK